MARRLSGVSFLVSARALSCNCIWHEANCRVSSGKSTCARMTRLSCLEGQRIQGTAVGTYLRCCRPSPPSLRWKFEGLGNGCRRSQPKKEIMACNAATWGPKKQYANR
ncbi:hypothetical protein FN846DRAFT_981288 [Sphaerosporella brunnea]|uniref:Secreted protein n=1 Tax=Sphaerosporella brunnea TaxID=1250544 RepID=A0A5J5EBK6_9PEZI|nr:hypothetical protein FN846DRAFT_981288 [Sphaerosporella brunnea]